MADSSRHTESQKKILKELAFHDEFFCQHDLIQLRYEVVRLVKLENVPIPKAVEVFGFKSRSSYYLFARMLREEGFVGLFDMRPLNRKILWVEGLHECSLPKMPREENRYLARPMASLWEPPDDGPWCDAFYGLQHNHYRLFVQVVRALAEGNGVRGIGRIFGIDKNTVLNYLERAARQCRRVTDLLIRDLHVVEAQMDEMWSFVFKKERNLSEEEYGSQLLGDQWCWRIEDARTKVIVNYEMGRRTYTLAVDLIKNFHQRTDGMIPSLITSDAYDAYEFALLRTYGVLTKGKHRVPPPDMDYAVIRKTRKKGRVVAITVEVVFGSLDRIEEKLEESPVSSNVNVSFVERSHLSRRQFNRRMGRKTLGFSKNLRNHRWQVEVETAIHNFVRCHRGIGGLTPMMAAGKADHPWSVEELLSFTR